VIENQTNDSNEISDEVTEDDQNQIFIQSPDRTETEQIESIKTKITTISIESLDSKVARVETKLKSGLASTDEIPNTRLVIVSSEIKNYIRLETMYNLELNFYFCFTNSRYLHINKRYSYDKHWASIKYKIFVDIVFDSH